MTNKTRSILYGGYATALVLLLMDLPRALAYRYQQGDTVSLVLGIVFGLVTIPQTIEALYDQCWRGHEQA